MPEWVSQLARNILLSFCDEANCFLWLNGNRLGYNNLRTCLLLSDIFYNNILSIWILLACHATLSWNRLQQCTTNVSVFNWKTILARLLKSRLVSNYSSWNNCQLPESIRVNARASKLISEPFSFPFLAEMPNTISNHGRRNCFKKLFRLSLNLFMLKKQI